MGASGLRAEGLVEVGALSRRLWKAAGRPEVELDVVALNDAPPRFRLAAAAGTGHYSAEEVAQLDFAGAPPDARALSRTWKKLLTEAEAIIEVLPADEVGKCVLARGGSLYRTGAGGLRSALARGELVFRPGSIRGALPVPVRG